MTILAPLRKERQKRKQTKRTAAINTFSSESNSAASITASTPHVRKENDPSTISPPVMNIATISPDPKSTTARNEITSKLSSSQEYSDDELSFSDHKK